MSKSQMLSAGILLCLASFHGGTSATSPLSICQFMDVAVMSAGLYTQCALQCVNFREQPETWATATRFIKRRQSVHTCRWKSHVRQTQQIL